LSDDIRTWLRFMLGIPLLWGVAITAFVVLDDSMPEELVLVLLNSFLIGAAVFCAFVEEGIVRLVHFIRRRRFHARRFK